MMCPSSQAAFWPFLWLGTVAVIGTAAAAENFTCGDYENAIDLGVGTDFSTVSVTIKSAVPGSVNWHIHVMGADSTPKYAAYPPGLLQPLITSSGSLQFELIQQLDGVSEGAPTPGAVDLFLPYTLVNEVSGSGTSETVQISNTNSSAAPSNLSIVDTGTNSKYYVNSSASPVNFNAQGSGTYVEAEVFGGSFTVTGGPFEGMIRNLGDELDVSMTGAGQILTIQGSYSSASVSGVGLFININDKSGCSKVNPGFGKCNEVDTVVKVSEPSCLSDPISGSSDVYMNSQTLFGVLLLSLVSFSFP